MDSQKCIFDIVKDVQSLSIRGSHAYQELNKIIMVWSLTRLKDSMKSWKKSKEYYPKNTGDWFLLNDKYTKYFQIVTIIKKMKNYIWKSWRKIVFCLKTNMVFYRFLQMNSTGDPRRIQIH